MPDFTANTTSRDVLFSTSVECSGQTAERLRLDAVEGLLALPRVGMGIGGFLLGSHGNGRIRITETRHIGCGHSGGPAFLLTADELAAAKKIAESVAPLHVVGLYTSKTRGPAALSEPVLEIFRELCPEPWQIFLLIRPSTVQRSSAVLFVRNAGGELAAAAEQDIETETAPDDEFVKKPEPVHVPVAKIEPLPSFSEENLSRVSEPLPGLQIRPEINRPAPFFPASLPAQPTPWLPWAFAGIALMAGGTGAWMTRDNWRPRPALALAATDRSGHLSIRWNSDAVRGVEGAVLSLNDGGDLHSYQLDVRRLQAGVMEYDRKSARVLATLRVGETRAIAEFFDPAPAAQNPPKAAEAPEPLVKRMKK